MELHIQSDEIGENALADLLLGPFAYGAKFPIIMANNLRHAGVVAELENDNTVIIEIDGERWFLRRLETGEEPLNTTLPIQHWIIGGRT